MRGLRRRRARGAGLQAHRLREPAEVCPRQPLESRGRPAQSQIFGQRVQSPWRTQAKMYRLIAVNSAISTHCTMAWSIHAPGGGAPGRMLRSGTMANRFAAYHVANGGKNFLLPNAIGMATNSAKVGRLIRTRQMPRSKISGPLALLKVITTFPLSLA